MFRFHLHEIPLLRSKFRCQHDQAFATSWLAIISSARTIPE